MNYFVRLIPIAFLLYSCSGKTMLQYHPSKDEKALYSFELTIGKSQMYLMVEFQVKEPSNDTLLVNTVIKRIEWFDGTKIDKEITDDYSKYVNTPLYFKMNAHGGILKELTHLETGESASKTFDVKLFFPDYPIHEIDKGYSWKNEREISEILFKSIKTEYTLTNSSSSTAYLRSNSVYVDPTKFITKDAVGFYTISRSTGLISKADITIDGFNGYSSMHGYLHIDRIN